MGTIAGFAWAKVNLGLRILDRRPDGFHELRTVFQTISLADRVEVETTPGSGVVSLTCPGVAGPDEDNLAFRAARAWLDLAGAKWDVGVTVEKRVPMGGGLGGGSSDAAAVLLALQALHPGEVEAAAVFQAAAGLGSDVPFFLVGGRAVGLGRGTEIYGLEDAATEWFLVLAPEVSIATPWAYKTLAESRPISLTHDRKEASIGVFCASVNAPRAALPESPVLPVPNDFESAIFAHHPRLGECRDWLQAQGALEAFLTGSGAAVVGRFADEAAARKAAGHSAKPTEAYVVHTVARAECHKWWHSPDG